MGRPRSARRPKTALQLGELDSNEIVHRRTSAFVRQELLASALSDKLRHFGIRIVEITEETSPASTRLNAHGLLVAGCSPPRFLKNHDESGTGLRKVVRARILFAR